MSSASFAQDEGYPRSDQGPIAGDPGWYFAALVLLGAAVFAAFTFWDRAEPQLRMPIIASVIACGVPFAFLVSRAMRVLQKIGRAKLITPFQSLAIGLPVTAVYTRPLKGDATVEAVEARLQLEERVTRGSGKNKKTFTAVALEQEIAPSVRPSGGQLRIEMPIRIPETGPPTINIEDVEVRWMVRMRLRMRGCPDTRSSFEINVAPMVVKR